MARQLCWGKKQTVFLPLSVVAIIPYFVRISTGNQINNDEATYSNCLDSHCIPNYLRIVRYELDNIPQLFTDNKCNNLGVPVMVESQLFARMAQTVWITFRPWMEAKHQVVFLL